MLHEDFCLLRCDAMQSVVKIYQTFRDVFPLASWYKSKLYSARQLAQHHVPEDSDSHDENLKSRAECCVFSCHKCNLMCYIGTEILQTRLLDQTSDGSSYLMPDKLPEVTTVKAQAKKDNTPQSGPQVKQLP